MRAGSILIVDCRLPIDDLGKALTAEDAENAETIELSSRGLRPLRVEGPVDLLGASLTPAECRGPSLGVALLRGRLRCLRMTSRSWLTEGVSFCIFSLY